jgi:hypothetical protein
VAQVAVYSQTTTKHINTVWAERTIVKIFNLLVHPVTSRLSKVNGICNTQLIRCLPLVRQQFLMTSFIVNQSIIY